MTIQHASIADPLIHEPKGVAAASAGTVYIADGAGSGDWDLLELDQYLLVHGVINDVSAAGSIYLPIPVDCTLVGATMVLGGAITVANASVTFFNEDSASLGSAVTITQSGSAAGTKFSFIASSNQNLTGPTYVRVTSDGGSTTTQPLYVTLYLTKTVSS